MDEVKLYFVLKKWSRKQNPDVGWGNLGNRFSVRKPLP